MQDKKNTRITPSPHIISVVFEKWRPKIFNMQTVGVSHSSKSLISDRQGCRDGVTWRVGLSEKRQRDFTGKVQSNSLDSARLVLGQISNLGVGTSPWGNDVRDLPSKRARIDVAVSVR